MSIPVGHLDRELAVSVFESVTNRQGSPQTWTLRRIADLVGNVSSSAKSGLPLIKLGRFKRNLRNNENFAAFDGIEGDYDGGEVSIDEAVERAKTAGIACLIYTSPSHTPEAPRWRIMLPCSTTCDPIERNHLMARANGAMGGTLTGESFTLAQIFYVGYVTGATDHRAVLVDGSAIDRAEYLDDFADYGRVDPNRADHKANASQVAPEVSDVAAAMAVVSNDGPKDWDWWKKIGMAIHAAVNGDPAGFEIFNAWSAKHPLYDAGMTADAWERVEASPAEHIGFGTLVHMARAAVPGWRIPSRPARPDGSELEPIEDEAPVAGRAIAVEPNPRWKDMCAINDKAKIIGNAANAELAFKFSPEWCGLLGFDEFADRIILRRAPPRSRGVFVERELRKEDVTSARIWLQTEGISVPKDDVSSVMALLARENGFHPVRDYLNGLTWDGVPRLNHMLRDYLGAADTQLNQAFSAKTLIAAVARVFESGCKVKTVLTLEGNQDIGKSKFCRALAGRGSWFTDTVPDLANKDAAQQLRGIWIQEHAELATLGKSDAARAKAFISTDEDRYRPSYGEFAITYPRQCIFVASVNPGLFGYMNDDTGGSRFWTVKCGIDWPAHGEFDGSAFSRVRDQLWSEAVYRYRFRETWWLDNVTTRAEQVETVAEREVRDVWHDIVGTYLTTQTDVSIAEVLDNAVRKPRAQWTKADQDRVGKVLRQHKMLPRQVRVGDRAENRREFRFFASDSALVTRLPVRVIVPCDQDCLA